MVLILVDGKATVADLCTKTSNSQMTESALRDLEEGGFIEPVMEQDSVWEQSKKVAQEIRAAALGHVFPSPSAETGKKEERVEPSFVPSPPPLLNEVADSSFSTFSTFSVAPVVSAERAAGNKISIFGVENVLDLPSPPPPPVEFPSWRDRLKALLPSGKQQFADDAPSLKPIRRTGSGFRFSWPSALIFGILGLGVLAFFVVLAFPYGRYLPEVEAALAQAIGQPARVGEMRVSFYPRPGLFLNDVRLGNGGEREVRISEMRLLPVLQSMTSSRKIFRDVTATGVILPAEALAGLSGVFDVVSGRVGVQHLSLEKVEISFRGMALSEMSGEIRLVSDGRFDSLVLYSPNRSLHLEAKPAAKGIDIEMEAYGWRPSPTSPFVFDSGNVRGHLDNATLDLSQIELRIFDGVVRGGMTLRSDERPSMAGEISFERINGRRFGEALGIGPQFEGETAGKVMFSALAESWSSLFSGVNAEGDFVMRRGVLGAIDLSEAVRRSAEGPVQGGSTRFESLSGRLKVTPGNYRLSGLVLNSGLMQSVGQLTVSKELQVSGGMEVQMRGTANQLRMPVSISGALKAPRVQAGRP